MQRARPNGLMYTYLHGCTDVISVDGVFGRDIHAEQTSYDKNVPRARVRYETRRNTAPSASDRYSNDCPIFQTSTTNAYAYVYCYVRVQRSIRCREDVNSRTRRSSGKRVLFFRKLFTRQCNGYKPNDQ